MAVPMVAAAGAEGGAAATGAATGVAGAEGGAASGAAPQFAGGSAEGSPAKWATTPTKTPRSPKRSGAKKGRKTSSRKKPTSEPGTGSGAAPVVSDSGGKEGGTRSVQLESLPESERSQSISGIILVFLGWSWVVLPLIKGGPSRVKAVLMAKFLNDTSLLNPPKSKDAS